VRSFAIAALLACSASGCVTPATDFPLRLTAIGAEPFWNLTIDGGRLGFREPDQASARTGSARRSLGDGGLQLAGTLAGETLRATIVAGRCSDGMSDRVYPYTASVRIGERLLSGCAWPTDNPPGDHP